MKEKIELAKTTLANLYSPEGHERIGFISNEDKVVEVINASKDPENGFVVSTHDILNNAEGQSWATWHTHPGVNSNLSGADYDMFKAWGKMVHFIIGSDGVKAYQYSPELKAVIKL